MKVLILGAAANMARPSIEYLYEIEEVEEIVLADLNLDKLTEIKEQYKDKVSCERVNINNKKELSDSLKGIHLVLNFVGPYFRFGTTVLEAAINQKVHYIDICDDYDVTIEAVKLMDRAKENDVTAIIGMGSSPGVTNMLSKLGADALDVAEEIHTYWAVGESDPGGYGALIHMFHIITGKIPTFDKGELKDIPAFQQKDARVINFGDSVGKIKLYHVGHPEPITLPKYIPEVKTVTNFGALLPEYQNPLFKTLVDFGLTSEKSISFKGEQVAPIQFLLAMLQDKQRGREGISEKENSSVTAVQIEVIGSKDKQDVTYTFTKAGYDATMATGTSYPIAVTSDLILQGDIKERGVLPPEALNPKTILQQLRKTEFLMKEDFNVTRSVNGKEVSANLFDHSVFPELWK